MPDTRPILEAFQPQAKWADIASAFGINPIVAIIFALEIRRAIIGYGFAAVDFVIHYFDKDTYWTAFISRLGNSTVRIPPSPAELVKFILERDEDRAWTVTSPPGKMRRRSRLFETKQQGKR